MQNLNDMIWSPEDGDLINPQPEGIGEGCMIERCMVAFCGGFFGPSLVGISCGNYFVAYYNCSY